MTFDENVSVMKDLAEGLIKRSILKWILGRLPFLTWGFLNPITGFLASELATYIVKEGEIGAFFLYTDFRVGVQKDAYLSSAQEWLSIKATGSKEEVALAKERFLDSSSAFISITA